MKKIIVACMFLLLLSGCGVEWAQQVPDAYYGSSTVIGVSAGAPEGMTLTIGYRRYEGLICRDTTDAKVEMESTATAEGVDVKQTIAFGEGVK